MLGTLSNIRDGVKFEKLDALNLLMLIL